MDGWMDWTGLDPLRSLVPLEHLAVLIISEDAIFKLMYAENSFPEAFDARS